MPICADVAITRGDGGSGKSETFKVMERACSGDHQSGDGPMAAGPYVVGLRLGDVQAVGWLHAKLLRCRDVGAARSFVGRPICRRPEPSQPKFYWVINEVSEGPAHSDLISAWLSHWSHIRPGSACLTALIHIFSNPSERRGCCRVSGPRMAARSGRDLQTPSSLKDLRPDVLRLARVRSLSRPSGPFLQGLKDPMRERNPGLKSKSPPRLSLCEEIR